MPTPTPNWSRTKTTKPRVRCFTRRRPPQAAGVFLRVRAGTISFGQTTSVMVECTGMPAPLSLPSGGWMSIAKQRNRPADLPHGWVLASPASSLHRRGRSILGVGAKIFFAGRDVTSVAFRSSRRGAAGACGRSEIACGTCDWRMWARNGLEWTKCLVLSSFM